MISFKQALNHFKKHWQNSLFLGAVATFLVILARYLPYVSALAVSFILLVLQHISENVLRGERWNDFSILKKAFVSFILISLILFPTSVLVGASLGILQSPQGFIVGLSLSGFLLILGVYFYLVLTHALRISWEEKITIAKAVDLAGITSFKNFKVYFVPSFYLGLGLALAGLTQGIGMIFVLPLVFYTSHFSYLEVKRLRESAKPL